MGCINSKRAASKASPAYTYSATDTENVPAKLEPLSRNQSGLLPIDSRGEEVKSEDRSHDLRKSRKGSGKGSFSFRLGFSHRYVDAEQNAAGWPSWLTAVAGEAIQGWVPLRADSFEKLEKIGQGTYSSVFRAHEVKTGRMFALKKVRFDNFQPESIRFMAREIKILRRLDHPNIMKLEGLITSRVSSSIYLVFEYMEHDLSGLVSCPDVKFSDMQIKCYMRQLLSGVEHCHLRGIMHRDIKTSNILVNDEGILKIGDFGLANVLSSTNKQELTSRVVTLWYRPPELLMGSTNYGVSVDLWSVGCVFAELFLGKPILKGRTEVEQLHKIFKLCGSPPDEFWKKSKLPHPTMFKPQNNYESSLRERCKDFPETDVNLIEMLLSIEPYKRGTASSALMSEYFKTQPYACDPSCLPKYPPNKEIDAKIREDCTQLFSLSNLNILRKKAGVKGREYGPIRKQRRVRKILQEPNDLHKSAPKEEVQNNTQFVRKDNGSNTYLSKGKRGALRRELLKPSFDTLSETSRVMNASQGYSETSGPEPFTGSSGFTWAKTRRAYHGSTLSDGSKSRVSALDSSFAIGIYDFRKQDNIDVSEIKETNDWDRETDETAKHEAQKHKVGCPESFDAADVCHYQDISMEFHHQEQTDALINSQVYKNQVELGEFSGPQLARPNRSGGLLPKNASHIRQAVRKSRFERDK
ncbi:GPCR kinase [Quillaja saponaria]|uniref:GPCR kinase n=1 Tax=Quillaja saponaria TaxID=32244 RepID=A0AAD7VCD6_QUISA|nr:GPCR kinase [Quillaja saponaria]